MITRTAPPSKTTREPRSFSAAALATGTPLLLWQALFFMGAGVVLVLMSFWTIKNFRLVPEYSLENWRDLLEDNLFRLIYLRTILYAGLAAILATLFAFPLAYGLAFTLLARARRVGLLLLIVPFFTSYLVRIYAWTFILADDGPINYALRSIGLPGSGMQGTLFAMEIGLLTAVFPLVTLILLLSLMNVDRTLIEAAHNLGAGRWRTIWEVVVPGARIGIVSAFSFAFMIAFGDYVSPSFLGGSTRNTLSILIVGATNAGGDFPKAAAIALVMVITLILILFGSFRLAFPPRKPA
ncbi:MAG: ABC transporter permease [Thermomicrobiales bacterium]|nr:ABC transporter permease [Thermomicrobiales bacterium]MCA9879955.1 ABC transporter permease [Thermomicrobiales bacterium]